MPKLTASVAQAIVPDADVDEFMATLDAETKVEEASMLINDHFRTRTIDVLHRALYAQWIRGGCMGGGGDIAAVQRCAIARHISFIEARKVVNEEYKNTTLPALASLGAAAVAKMFQNGVKIGNIQLAACDHWWVACEVIKVRGTHDHSKDLRSTDWRTQVAERTAVAFTQDPVYAAVGAGRFSVADCLRYVEALWFEWSGRRSKKLDQQKAVGAKKKEKRPREPPAAPASGNRT